MIAINNCDCLSFSCKGPSKFETTSMLNASPISHIQNAKNNQIISCKWHKILNTKTTKKISGVRGSPEKQSPLPHQKQPISSKSGSPNLKWPKTKITPGTPPPTQQGQTDRAASQAKVATEVTRWQDGWNPGEGAGTKEEETASATRIIRRTNKEVQKETGRSRIQETSNQSRNHTTAQEHGQQVRSQPDRGEIKRTETPAETVASPGGRERVAGENQKNAGQGLQGRGR
jgi:hypothetical protein